MSLAFFYLFGQNGTYLASSWYGGIVTALVIALISFIATSFDWHVIVAVALGWFSVAFITEDRLCTSTKTFVCHKKPIHHHQLLFFVTEVFIFVCIKGIANIDDGAFWIWIIIAPLHVFYIVIVDALNRYSHRIKQGEFLARLYYLIYAVLLVVADIYFMFISIIVVNRSQNIAAVTILAALTFVILYVKDNLDFAHHFDFILVDRKHVHGDNKNLPAVASRQPTPTAATSSSGGMGIIVVPEDQV